MDRRSFLKRCSLIPFIGCLFSVGQSEASEVNTNRYQDDYIVPEEEYQEIIQSLRTMEHHKIIGDKCELGAFVPAVVRQAIRNQNIKHEMLIFFVVCGENVYEHLYSHDFIRGAKIIRSVNLPPNEFRLEGVKK